jgi:hypothetical protein
LATNGLMTYNPVLPYKEHPEESIIIGNSQMKRKQVIPWNQSN